MFKIDGKELDLTKPETLQGVTIKEGGYIEQVKDGVVVRVEPVPEVKPADNRH